MRVSLMAALLATTVAWAHGPTRQKVTETVTIKAAPDAVWARIKDYGAMQPGIRRSKTPWPTRATRSAPPAP